MITKNTRCIYLGSLFLVYLTINQLTRLALLFLAGSEALDGWQAGLWGAGLINDILPFFLMTLPLAALVLLPKTCRVGRIRRLILSVLFGAYTTLFLFTALSEGFFWDEFNCRFNFIAVDYLVYTNEVIGNIMESYPVIPLLVGIVVCAGLCSWLLLRPLGKRLDEPIPPARPVFAVWMVLLVGSLVFSPIRMSDNVLCRELAANGVWSLFSAFRNNQLDYRQFYPIMDNASALKTLHAELDEPGATFFSDNPTEWRRHIRAQAPERNLNVIQIVVESLGKASLGERTPNINAIAGQSLQFTQMMATGTRTVRGIEALTLSLPPAPGASIVRRPGNANLFNIGTVFRQRGYDRAFIYGGYGYFDNMNAFFSENGFRVVDRTVIPDKEKTFGNTWGVCDEDLLNTALREADASHATGTLFYQFVLTTSNHRPFTYPDGKVDVPSGSSRSGAIKYTDYAIGQFLREAEKRPWFRNTIFVIVADHTAGSAGKTDIPPDQYEIPCLIYSPAHIEAQSVDTLCSQIDLAPTLFALLGWSYDSGFFGNNILTMKPEQGRAWIGTYQLLGRLTAESLVVLEPLKSPRLEKRVDTTTLKTESEQIASTLAGYQSTQDLFTQGLLHENELCSIGVSASSVKSVYRGRRLELPCN